MHGGRPKGGWDCCGVRNFKKSVLSLQWRGHCALCVCKLTPHLVILTLAYLGTTLGFLPVLGKRFDLTLVFVPVLGHRVVLTFGCPFWRRGPHVCAVSCSHALK